MAKQSGLGDNFYIAGYDLSGDVNSLENVGGGPATGDITGISAFANERIGLYRSGGLSCKSIFNDATGQMHDAFKSLPTFDVGVEYRRGTALGGQVAVCVANQINYDLSRTADGMLMASVEVLSNAYGLEWCTGLTTGKRTDTSATNGTSVDFGTAGTNGAQAYLQVFSFTGTSVTVKIQSSSDNGGGDAFADVAGLTFTAATGRTNQRLAVTGAIERYLRVVTTGTFSNAVFAVSANVNQTATVF